MIIDIRGTHGSGKSWIMHQLLSISDHTPILEDGGHTGYYFPQWDAALLGKYTNVCGGCDGIKTADEVCRRVRLFHTKYSSVLLEGILVSHTFKRYNELAIELGDYAFAILDTPRIKCEVRVRTRRWVSGNKKPLNPTNLNRDHKGVHLNMPDKLRNAGRTVVQLPWQNPLSTVLGLLE